MHTTHTVNQNNQNQLNVVQITDTHLFKCSRDTLLGVNTEDSFHSVVEKCLAEHGDADFFLVTGDIAQQQDKCVYQRFFDYMDKTGKPYFCIAGNHDATEHMSYAQSNWSSNQVIETSHWRFILLDSSFNCQPSGHLADADLAWLADFLANTSDTKATMVVLHHHPVALQSAWIDQHMLQNASLFWKIIEPYAHVRTVCCGHVHQAYDDMHHGVRVIAAPSTSIQFKPRCQEFTIDKMPAGFRWLQCHSDGTITTDVTRLDTVPDTLDLSSDGY